MTTAPRAASRWTALLASAAALLVLTGCSSGGGADSDAGGAFADTAETGSPAQRSAADGALAENAADTAGNDPDPTDRSIISTGNVSLTSDDVEQAAFDVQQVADEAGGEVTEQKTTTADDGEVRTARLVLRVPAADFATTFATLEQDVADLVSSSSSSEDVTTEVIDHQVRIRAQRRSLARVEVLLDRAESISDIVRIEAQLTRRTAELESLEQRLAYLQDQAAMSTITVNIERTAPDPQSQPDDDEAGFLAGLSSGWHALQAVGTGLATLAGAVLPFAVIGALLAAPALLLLRRSRRRPAAPAADA